MNTRDDAAPRRCWMILLVLVALPALTAGNVFSIIDIESNFFYCAHPKYYQKSYYIKPLVPQSSLLVYIRDGHTMSADGSRVLSYHLPSSEYRWLGGQAITPVLRYTGQDRYLATVRGQGHTLYGRPAAVQYLVQLRDSLMYPSYMAPHLDVVFIIWETLESHRRSSGQEPRRPAAAAAAAAASPTPAPTPQPSVAVRAGVAATPETPMRRPPPVVSAIPPTVAAIPPTSTPIAAPTEPPTVPPAAPPTVPTAPPTTPAAPTTASPTVSPFVRPTPPVGPPPPPPRRPRIPPTEAPPPTALPTIRRRPSLTSPFFSRPFPTRRPGRPSITSPFFRRPFSFGTLNVDDLLNQVIRSGNGTITTTRGSSRNVTSTRTQTRRNETRFTRLP